MDPAWTTDTQKTAFDYDDLLRCGRGELFGLDNARLPLPDMLMLHRISSISSSGGGFGRGQVSAELDITPNLWFFGCHFDNDPVMPGCLGLDALWQMAGFFLLWQGHRGRGRAFGVGEVVFSGQISPGTQIIHFSLDIKRVMRRGLTLVVADGTIRSGERIVATARNLKVGLVQSTGSEHCQ